MPWGGRGMNFGELASGALPCFAVRSPRETAVVSFFGYATGRGWSSGIPYVRG